MTDVNYYLDLPYTKVLRRDDEGDIVATVAELDGCIAHGADESEALVNLREAQMAWLEHAITAGQDVPVPELEEELPSGKFVVRMPKSLHHTLNKLSKKDDVSLNQLMVVAVTDYVARREASTRPVPRSAWHEPSRGTWARVERVAATAPTPYLLRIRELKSLTTQTEIEEGWEHSHGQRERRG